MTEKHFQRMAEIVRAIKDGDWTSEPPDWADKALYDGNGNDDYDYTRAVHAAEVFILVALEFNPRFDVTRFLQACGLREKVR